MSADSAPSHEPQCAGAVLLVRPASFGFNGQTAASNAFQHDPPGDAPPAALADAALREFEAVGELLTRAGVQVVVAQDTAQPIKPDAVFPNNWVSFHRDGTVVLYPLLAANRRPERRDDIVRLAAREAHFVVKHRVDLSGREGQARYLEGTGSLVLDRASRIAYACLSPRTDRQVLEEFAQALRYETVIFQALDVAGRAIYHTNVMMAVGERFAVLCTQAIASADERAAVLARLQTTGHEVLDISPAQMHCFAGNLLQLRGDAGAVVALSNTAWDSLDAGQRRRLERHGHLALADIPHIERFGGGGVRCMLAELPAAQAGRAGRPSLPVS